VIPARGKNHGIEGVVDHHHENVTLGHLAQTEFAVAAASRAGHFVGWLVDLGVIRFIIMCDQFYA
jgi:hypothetical protein